MTDKDPNEKVKAWDQTSFVGRIQDCKRMLYLHEFITDAERSKIEARIARWVYKKRNATCE